MLSTGLGQSVPGPAPAPQAQQALASAPGAGYRDAPPRSRDRVCRVPLPRAALCLAQVRRRHPLSHGVSRCHDPLANLDEAG